MKKATRFLALVTALVLLLSLTALASGGSDEASGEAENTALFTVADGTVTAQDGNYTLSGEIGPERADGIELTVGDFTASGIRVTGGEYVIEDSVITHEVSLAETATTAGGYCAGVTGGVLTIRNSTLTSKGKGGVFGNYVVYCAENGTLVVIDSNIVQLGTAGDPEGLTDAVMEPPSNGGLLISGYSRANMSMGVTKTYYYGSTVETDGWAAMSTDMTRDLSFYAYDSVGRGIHGGYGTYADTSCKDWFYGSVLSGAELGAIISNNGQIHMAAAADATEEALAYLPADYELSAECLARNGRSVLEGGRHALQIHSPEESRGATRGMIAVFEASDTELATREELYANATLVDWAKDYGPAVAEYIDFTRGAIFVVKSACADIDLTRCTAESTSDTLLETVVNSDSMSCYALKEHDMTGRGTMMTLTDCAIAGDVKAYDYQRSCAVELVGTTWSGAYETWTKDEWDAVWSDAAKADPLCYWVLDPAVYHDGTGSVSSLSIDGGSTWIVTGESCLTSLTVAPGGAVEGTVAVDGVATDVSAGGEWTGSIVVTPLQGSAEPSGEAS